jgi:hypothetical protein
MSVEINHLTIFNEKKIKDDKTQTRHSILENEICYCLRVLSPLEKVCQDVDMFF